MPLVGGPPVSLPSPTLIKMEERKRPAGDDDSAPPLKRQAITVNGTSKPHPDTDMPYQDDLERFQKEAIWRQMQEFKREKNTLETQLKELTKRTTYHDDHLRTMDAWFSQLLDEVKLLVGNMDDHEPFSPFPSALLNSDSSTFEQHLGARTKEISSAISDLFGSAKATSPDISDLLSRIAQSLATEKIHITELEKSRKENGNLEERLEAASLRYMLAEKKLDRVKSTTVQKLERQAISGGQSESGSGLGGATDGKDSKVDSEALFEAEKSRKEAFASCEKQREQLAALEADNEKLTAQITTLETRFTHLSDDDYSKTDLFKYVKSQHEDVIKRVNDLEATNVKLREEAEKLQAERATYRYQAEEEVQMSLSEKDAQLVQAENDLARIRTTRDELVANNAMQKATLGQERASFDQMKELYSSYEERIKVLESEIERWKMPSGQANGVPSPQPSIEEASTDELQTKYTTLEKQYAMLKTELQSMEKVYQKTSAVAAQKVNHLTALEEKVLRLGAEKSKADQKYFAAMKAKEAREQEVRSLRAQNSKTSEIVSQLKEADLASRNLLGSLERQIVELKGSLTTIGSKTSATQQQLNEKNILLEGLKAQVEELKKNLIAKDNAANTAASAQRKAEVESEARKVSLEETQKSLETWKKKALGNQSSEAEMLRTLAICNVCRVNFKDTVIKSCGHVLCLSCIEERNKSRSRKCPNCNKMFNAQSDLMHITL